MNETRKKPAGEDTTSGDTMRPTEQLVQEHTAILGLLDILGEVCNRLEAGKDLPAKDLQDIMEFLKVFVDTCHHGKEEGYLFPALERAGIPRQNGPIGVMLSEHDLGRRFVKGMAEALNGNASTGKQFSSAFSENARNYVNLLKMHIMKENSVLFPMAERSLSPDIQQEMIGQFDLLEEQKIGAGRHEEFHRLLKHLKASYLPGRP